MDRINETTETKLEAIHAFSLDGMIFAVPHRGDWQEWQQPGAEEVPEAEIDW